MACLARVEQSQGPDNFERISYESVQSLPEQGWAANWWPHFASLPAFFYPYNVNAQVCTDATKHLACHAYYSLYNSL
jgi:hypothetical protein